jgi:CheY-like chemotaxis protein
MMEDPRTISTALEIAWIAKAIERIGDHVKNIAEQVIYIVRGTDVRHISKERRRFGGRRSRDNSAMECRVLVVEDDPAIQELLRFTLRKSGLTATITATAEEAMAALNGALPEVVLIDWMLPKTSGITLARQLRQNPRTTALPIIMVTAKRRGERPRRRPGDGRRRLPRQALQSARAGGAHPGAAAPARAAHLRNGPVRGRCGSIRSPTK